MTALVKTEYKLTQRSIADQYFYGEGTEQNLTEALRWYLMAAENGDTVAQSFLTICLENLGLTLETIDQLDTSDWFASMTKH